MRSSRFWLLLVAVALLGVALWWGRQAKRAAAPTNAERPHAAAAMANGAAPKAVARAEPAGAAGSAATEDAAVEAARQERIARYVAAAEAEYVQADVPLQFWGRVIDQANEPIAGVEVAYAFAAFVPNSRGEMRTANGRVATDAAGNFTIEGIRGHRLTIARLTKAGHAAVGLDGRWYSYARLSTQGGEVYRPDARAPVIFKMERLSAAQALWTFENRLEVPVNGAPQRSSTADGKLGGAFRVQFQAGPAVNEKKTVYDWTFTLQLEGGGVQRSVDEFMGEAPADGYYDKIEVVMKTSNPAWNSRGTIRLFARTAAGHYGRFVVEVGAPTFSHDPTARVTIKGAVNPAGSRNLTPPAGR